MIVITPAQIQAAQRGNPIAATAIIREMEHRIGQLARREGRSETEVDDLTQQGRIIVWEALPRFRGTDAGQLFGFLNESLRRELAALRRSEQFPGVSEHTVKIWQKAIALANGDLARAVTLATDASVMGVKRKLSVSLAGSLREMTERPPAVSTQTLAAYAEDTSSGDDSYWFADLDQMGMTSLAAEAPSADEITSEQRAETGRRVRWVLDQMGQQQADILRALVGMGDMPFFDKDSTEDNDELAALLGIARKSLSGQRTRAIARFRALWLAHFGPIDR